MVAIAAAVSLKDTPTAEEVGRIVDMAVARSDMCVLPRETAAINVLVASTAVRLVFA